VTQSLYPSRSWGEFLHLALFDLSLKHERRAHALERDLVAHLLASWPLYQLPRFFNTLLPVGGGCLLTIQ
jgi:hypothetical protein